MWNHFSTVGPRTNNNLESYNSRLNKLIAVPHPNIWKFINMIKSEELNTTLLIYRIDNKILKSQYRRAKYILTDLKISNMHKNFFQVK